MDMLNQKQKIIAIVVGIVIICIIIYYYINSTKNIYNVNEFSSQDLNESIEENEEVEKMIVVHVTGAVEKQGIVKVKENARINDVIESAGGLASGADLNKVNLAYMVEDGQKIYIPYEEDNKENIDDGEIITQNAGEEVLENDNSTQGTININTATEEKLTEIPGIRKCYGIKDCYI